MIRQTIRVVLFTLALAAGASAQTSLVSTGAVWKYLDDGSDQGTAWRVAAFNDSLWASGPAQLGYGDGDESTTNSFGPDSANKYITTYYRRTFDVPNAAAVTNLLLRVLRDDGAVVYLNGTEVLRDNMPAGTILFSTPASAAIEDAFAIANPSPGLLVTGPNTLAVEIHQSGATSTDISFDLELTANFTPVAPAVTILSPTNSQTIASTTVTIQATATDNDGAVTNVSFFSNGAKIGEDTTAPYSFVWLNVNPGTYSVFAEATDTTGLKGRSVTNSVNVTAPPQGTLIALKASWKYLATATAAPSTWFTTGFDDTAWPSGLAELGYGDGDESPSGIVPFGPDTNNKWPTTYFRKRFNVSNPALYAGLSMTTIYDDGAVIYLNGQEIHRIGMASGPIAYSTFALAAAEYTPDTTSVNPALLVAGENVIAVEMHQGNATSSDLSFDLQLIGQVPPSVSIVSPANNSTFIVPFSFNLSADASDPDGSLVAVEFFDGAILLGVATNAPYGVTVNSLSEGPHQLTAKATDNTGLSSVSAPINITVNDPNPPSLLDASATTNRVNVTFSKALVNPSATAIANYSINPPLQILSAAYGASSNTIALTTSFVQPGVTYTLTVNNVRDRAGNAIAPNSQITFEVVAFEPQDIGNPAIAGSLTPVGGGYDYSGGGTNLGGTSDQFAFAYTERTGDFDFQMRVQTLSLSDVWAKSGLMARETLTANSRFAAAISTPSLAGAFFQSRSTAGGAATIQGSYPANYPNMYLRLKRVGTVFTGYASWDGQLWTQLGTVTLAGMPNTIYLGMTLVSGSTQPVSAEFRDLQDASGGTFGAFVAPIEPSGPSTRRTGLVITEIMYKPAPRQDGRVIDFIELYNSNPYWEDISGYRISADADYTFPPGTIMQGGSYLVIAANPGDIIDEYGISNVTGPYTNTLATEGTIRLRNKEDAVLLEILYSNEPPWPVAADGTGHSLVLAKPSYGENNPAAWAASDRVGGSPGRQDGYTADALRNVTINEFLANSQEPLVDFIELYNHSRQPVNISGCVLTDDKDENKFIIPTNTVIPANGFVVFYQPANPDSNPTETELNFGLSSGGEIIYFKAPDGSRILDAVSYEAQGNGISSGRHPDGSADMYPFATRTPGARNGAILIDDIVINEIMYEPISRDSDDEYIELYNKGNAPVDIGAWRFTSGISYLFPSNTIIGPGNYLVVARNAARMMSNYANLNPTNVLGNFGGSLANSGERLALARPDLSYTTNFFGEVSTNLVFVVVDEVTYVSGGHWGEWHNEGGSSLELVDPNSDHRLAYNWAGSDETGKSQWTTISATGSMEQGLGTANFIELLTLAEGEYLVDNVEVINNSVNMLATGNSSFDGGMGNWNGRGTHIRSQWDANRGVGGTGCLHVRASARGDTMHNRALCTISVPSGVVTLKAQVRWLSGWPEFLMRLHGNHYEAFTRLSIPKSLGTPGAANSRAVANAGPAIAKVVHSPVLPGDNEQAVVTARISDMDGLASATLFYRTDPNNTYATAPMVDNGTGGDLIANDGIYSGVIPGQSAGTMVAFYVRAIDDEGATTTLPRDASPTGFECLVRFGETNLTSSFGTYRQWFTQNNVNRWANQPALSNERTYGTFIYGNVRVIYNHNAKYSSSPYHQGQHSSGPVTSSCHYAIELPADDECLGSGNWNKVHAPGNSAFDENTNQREQIGYWFARQMGLPWNYRRYVHMFVNGTKKGSSAQIMEDTERGGDDFVDARFPDDRDGNLYKMQPWFEVDDGTALQLGFVNQNWCTLNRYSPATNSAVHLTPRYRHNWLVRAANSTANDFAPVFNLIDAAQTPTNGWTAHTAAMENIANMEEWTRVFAVCHSVGDWDHFGTQNSQNMYSYKPERDKFHLMIWDFNILLGNSGSWGPGQNLFVVTATDTRMPWLYSNPKFRRMYLRGLKEMADVHMQASSVDPVIDARQNAFVASSVNVPIANVNTLKTWIRDARLEIARQVAIEDTNNFIVLGPTTVNITSNLVVLSGLAPVSAHSLRVNGISYDVTWTTVRNWTLRLAVDQPTTVLNIQGYDVYGRPLTGMTGLVTVNYSGPTPIPQDALVINEIMYNPSSAESSFIELYNRSSSAAFDVSGWRLNGAGYTFPQGSIILPGQFVVIAKNSSAVANSFGSVTVFDTFDAELDNDGETISLVKPAGDPFNEADDIVIDKVRYDDSAPWPTSADGSGPGIQLIDAGEDNARVSNWTDGQGWRYVTYLGTNQGSATPSLRGTNFFVFLNSSGDVFIDDMKLVIGNVPEVGDNLLSNGDFEQPFAGEWVAGGNHSGTAQSTVTSRTGTGSLRLASTGVGSTSGGNNLRQFIPGSTTNRVVTLSFWLLPSTNGTTISMRTAPGSAFNGTFNIRPTYATPGAPNTVTRDLPAYPQVWINEVQAVNPNGVRDNMNEAEPWIELYNPTATPISLDGYYLSDDYNVLNKWAFPAGSTLNPGQFKLVWADNEIGETTATDWHTSVTLNSPTGSLALARSFGGEFQLVDYVNYSGQSVLRSYGDFPDAQPFQDQVLYEPTPGTTNTGRSVSVFINEWMAANTSTPPFDPVDGDYEDWIELYNPGAEDVDLSGFWLTDNLTNATQYRIPDGTIIRAGSYMLVWADNEDTQTAFDPDGRLHLNFGLRAQGEDIGLFAPNGFTLVDGINDFPPQTNNITQGRYPDAGPGPFPYMTNATPERANIPNGSGGANQQPNVPPIADKHIILGETLSFNINATDPNPGQSLTYSGTGFPSGANINGFGVFQWTPSPAQAPSVNPVEVTATDNGTPAMSRSRSFTIHVSLPPTVAINRETGGVTMSLPTIPGRRYQVRYKDGLEDDEWLPLGGPRTAAGTSMEIPDTIGAQTQRFYKIEILAD